MIRHLPRILAILPSPPRQMVESRRQDTEEAQCIHIPEGRSSARAPLRWRRRACTPTRSGCRSAVKLTRFAKLSARTSKEPSPTRRHRLPHDRVVLAARIRKRRLRAAARSTRRRNSEAGHQAAGLGCESCHYNFSELKNNLDERIAFAKELGLKQMVLATFGLRAGGDPRRLGRAPATTSTRSANRPSKPESRPDFTTTTASSRKSTASSSTTTSWASWTRSSSRCSSRSPSSAWGSRRPPT